MVGNAYSYLFYKLSQWSKRINPEDDFHAFYASGMIAVVVMINFLTVVMAVEIMTKYPLDLTRIPKLGWVAVVLSLFALNYVYFTRAERSVRILARYAAESRASARIGSVIVTCYVIGSFLLLLGLGFWAGHREQISMGPTSTHIQVSGSGNR